MSKKISQLTELTTVGNADVLAVVNSGETKKVTKQNLLKEINDSLATKSAVGHTHDDRYYTEGEITGLLAGKSDVGHSHAWGTITGLLSSQADLQSALDAKANASHNHAGVYEPANANIQSHISSVANPHSVTKSQVGLGNVDNTSDANKPVSTATQTALNAKQNSLGFTPVNKIGDTMSGKLEITIPVAGNVAGLMINQNDTTNNPLGINVVSASIGNDRHGIQSVLSGVITSSYQGAVFGRISNASSTNGHSFYADHAGSSGSGFRMWYSGSGSVSGVDILHDNSSTTGASFRATNYGSNFGAGGMFSLNHQNIGSTFYATQTVINKNWTSGNGIQLTGTSTVNDGATYSKSASLVNLTSQVQQTSGTITDSAQILDINQLNSGATGNVVDIDNDGTGNTLDITNSINATAINVNVVTTSKKALAINNTGIQTSAEGLVRFKQSNTSTTVPVIEIAHDGSGKGIFLDINGNGRPIDVDHDGNSASAITGLWVNVANAGAGGAYAAIFEAGLVGVGTIAPTAQLDINSDILRLRTAKTPATAGASGNQGDIAWDSNYLYVCTSTNAWKRAALATW